MKSLITIKKIQDLLLKGLKNPYVDDETSRRMWWASLEVIQKEFLSYNYHEGGLWVASPLPALNEKKYFSKLKGWLWSPEGFPYFHKEHAGFLPADHSKEIKRDNNFIRNYKVLNLNPKDGYEPFLMIITPKFQCVLTIAGEQDKKNLIMRCDKRSLKTVIELIDAKFYQENYEEGINFRNEINNLGDLKINDQFADNFWPILSIKLANLTPILNKGLCLGPELSNNLYSGNNLKFLREYSWSLVFESTYVSSLELICLLHNSNINFSTISIPLSK